MKNNKENKRMYSGLSIETVKLDFDRCICNASVLQNVTVLTTGQEEGETIDLSSSNEFNHVWEEVI